MGLRIRESVTFDQAYREAETIWYSANTCWWTHKAEDVREATLLATGGKESPIPLDPSGSPLMYAPDDAKSFLNSARQNLDHYGKHKLRAFMGAHHRNAFDLDGRPTCSSVWDDYNDAIDHYDSSGIAYQPEPYAPVVPPQIYDDKEIIARCLVCNAEFTEAQISGKSACPKCRDPGMPASPDLDVTVKINWHELRVLCIWAENYANNIASLPDVKGDPVKTIWAIAARLQEQYPSFSPLTLSGELGQVKEKFGDQVEIIESNIRLGGPLPPKVS